MTMVVLILGLVVDGGRQLAAQQEAEAIAQRAARSGVDASAAGELLGRVDHAAADRAASRVLAESGVPGATLAAAGRLRVTTSVQKPTVFLSVIGIGTVTGTGEAEARLLPARP
ncbi:pilus assembly protein TadE [Naumannella cuiyingiana]|uniref:Uncharacterized protein YbjT (DUF2867 family) n=1 Tax=Naumannella cuiyingiana TaxID=1347891 RepID=A0A7Z0IKD2_9ACTN|nr:pilus assembly protein TadE [Naumannella cuiyingiana]NYI70342.1 uncharacterized protein YbjT (DUF2867 family) [Naumannella cuiyingiana]